MSTRDDIIDGSVAPGRKYGLIYTRKCGWIDLGHANPEGVSRLYALVRANTHNVSTEIVQAVNKAILAGATSAILPLALHRLYKDYQLSNLLKQWGDYYIVYYEQSMSRRVIGPIKLSASKSAYFFIKKNLSITQQQAVTLAIFMKISHAFESMQGSWPYSWVTDSGYSVEDLMSNLLGFYRAINPTINYIALCQPVSKAEALYVWDKYGAVGSTKNNQFKPYLYPTSESDSVTPGLANLPDFLNQVTPAIEGELFIQS